MEHEKLFCYIPKRIISEKRDRNLSVMMLN